MTLCWPMVQYNKDMAPSMNIYYEATGHFQAEYLQAKATFGTTDLCMMNLQQMSRSVYCPSFHTVYPRDKCQANILSLRSRKFQHCHIFHLPPHLPTPLESHLD